MMDASSNKGHTRCIADCLCAKRSAYVWLLFLKDLFEQEGIFRTLVEEFGSSVQNRPTSTDGEGEVGQVFEEDKEPEDVTAKHGGGKLLLDEERNTGSVSLQVYLKYLRAVDSWWYVGLCTTWLVLVQASNVGNSLFLGYWSGSEIAGFSQGQYMAVYAGESTS